MGWPLGFKLANLCPRYHFLFLALSVVSMGVSGWLLYVAQRTIPDGYGLHDLDRYRGVGTVLLGIVFFHDAVTSGGCSFCRWSSSASSAEDGALGPLRPPHPVEDQRRSGEAPR